MSRFVHSEEARDDLLAIWFYVAEDDEEAADRLLDIINEKCALLAANPKIGPVRPDVAAGLRFFSAGSYLILYREGEDGIEVVRVLHGARNLEALFESRG